MVYEYISSTRSDKGNVIRGKFKESLSFNWASMSEPIITWTVSIAFLYVCMYGSHSVLTF